jgi:hypothetical protein
VIRHIRPKLGGRGGERIIQAPRPDLPIEKGRPGPGLVANVVVSKYLDGLPLYRSPRVGTNSGWDFNLTPASPKSGQPNALWLRNWGLAACTVAFNKMCRGLLIKSR